MSQAILVGGAAVAGSAIAGPVGAAIGATIGWIVGRGLAPSLPAIPVAPPRAIPVPVPPSRVKRNVQGQADCDANQVFHPYSRTADSQGECRPLEPVCPEGQSARWLIEGGERWECRPIDSAGTMGLGAACPPGYTPNPLPVGAPCLALSESAYTSGGPNRGPFAGLVAGPRVFR